MAFEDCPSGLYERGCENGRYCVPIVRDAEADAAEHLSAAGFNVFSYIRDPSDMSVRTCSEILQPQHAAKLAQLTGQLPDVTLANLQSGVDSMWQIRAHEDAKYQDIVAVEEGLKLR